MAAGNEYHVDVLNSQIIYPPHKLQLIMSVAVEKRLSRMVKKQQPKVANLPRKKNPNSAKKQQ